MLHLPAIAVSRDPLKRKPGEALWSSAFPLSALEDIRQSIGSRAFATLYQGDVSSASGLIFKRDWLRRYDQTPEKFTKIVQAWDTSFKTGKENDFSVGVTIGATSSGFYILNVARGRWEFPELKRQVALQAEQWSPHEILIEDRASGQSLLQELRSATSFPVVAVPTDKDKITRASACTGFFESGRVFLPIDAHWVDDFIEELTGFPGAQHDDQVDAIVHGLNRLRSRSGISTLVDWMKGISASGGVDDYYKAKPEPIPIVKAPSPATNSGDACPSCGATCISKVGSSGNSSRCSQCGLQFGSAAQVTFANRRGELVRR